MSNFLLDAKNVTKSFNGVPALRNGQLELSAGSVHALCGGNGAGKSTFLNIVMGILRRDSGTILLKGKPVDFASPSDALANRISIITQELSPLPGMSVSENIYLGREPKRSGFVVNFQEMHRNARALLEKLRFDIEPTALMSSLSLAQTQLVEIAKAFSRDSDIMIMDEPTSAIGEKETEILFEAIHSLTAQGTGIIYVSHRLSEIFTIADRYTVFRDGSFVESGNIKDIDRKHLVKQIVGQELTVTTRQSKAVSGPPLLEIKNLSRPEEFNDISLSIKAGEVLGIYGLMGSGRSELLNCIYGLTSAKNGSIHLKGKPLPPANPAASIVRGLSLVTEDRKETGLVLSSSVRTNITLSALPLLSVWSVVQKNPELQMVKKMVDRMRIKAATMDMNVSGMSGGNQQKVVLARCLSTNPICLLCDEPTRGIDEGAKREIYTLLSEFVAAGGCAIVVSSEAPEILEVSDRIAIFKGGNLVDIIDGPGATQEQLLHLAS